MFTQLESIQDNRLGLLILRSQATATKNGPWSFQDHTSLVMAIKELESLRDAVNRYSTRISDYRDGVEEAIQFLGLHDSWCTRGTNESH